MALSTTRKRVDDLGSAGEATTVNYSFNGKSYTIDLNKRNRETFERHMQRWIKVSRKRAYTANSFDLTEVREWARSEGIAVGNRGRISPELLAKFQAARSAE